MGTALLKLRAFASTWYEGELASAREDEAEGRFRSKSVARYFWGLC